MYELKLNNVEFPRRGKGATGTKVVQVLGDWKPQIDEDGKVSRPELTQESIDAISALHLSAFDSILPKLNWSIGRIMLEGINSLQEKADASIAGMLLARAIGDGFDEAMAKALQGAALNLVKSGKYDAEKAYQTVKTLFS